MMKNTIKLIATTALLVASTVSFATENHATGHAHGANEATVGQAGDTASGEVKKIDKQAQKITLKHGEIKNLDMPAMTMVFRVQNPALLDTVKVGDAVRFSATSRDGVLVVTTIEAVK